MLPSLALRAEATTDTHPESVAPGATTTQDALSILTVSPHKCHTNHTMHSITYAQIYMHRSSARLH